MGVSDDVPERKVPVMTGMTSMPTSEGANVRDMVLVGVVVRGE